MKFTLCLTHRKQTASFRMTASMLAIAPLWLMLAAANTLGYAQTSSPADWTEFHRDNMQRWNPYETALGVNNVGTLGLKWASPLFTPTPPVVANGVAYVGSVGVDALDASTGAVLWSNRIGGTVPSSPAVANGVVYFGGFDHDVHALNASTGALLWSFTTGDMVYSSPTVVNGVVYIGSNDGNVYALNATTGAKLWSFSTGTEVLSSPAIANGVVYVGSVVGNLYALNASTGAELWSLASIVDQSSSPAVANGVVYIGSDDHNVYALNASTGTKQWSYTTGNRVESSPAVANGVVYIGSDDGNVYALNASTGAKLWSFATEGPVAAASPAVANGVVYVGSNDQNEYALNASTGAKLWSFAANVEESSSPVVVNGVVYASSGDQVLAFALGAGGGADLFLRVQPSATTVHQGDLFTVALPVWNLGPDDAVHEVLTAPVPVGTTFDSISISGTPGLGTCTTPSKGGTGQIVCHENGSMAPNTTWTVRLTLKVTAPSGTGFSVVAATMADTPDPNLANNTAFASLTVQPTQSADLFLRVQPSTTTVHQGDLITYAFPVWNLGPSNADFEVLNTQVPAGTTFDSIRISGTPGLGTCTTPPYQGTGQIVCHENGAMALNTTWTVRLTVKVTAPAGTIITENAATMAGTPDPNLANNTATVSLTVVP
jgi:outer membrane protein assembly factor BamB